MTQHFLVFATNFKAENPYLIEWLDYHLLVGVDHFYLYDQDGSNEAQELLKPYEQAGLVTRHPWTHFDGTKYDRPTKFYQKNKNHLAFSHCATHYRHQFSWVMKIDVDEFLYPLNTRHNVIPYLKTLNRDRIKGISVPRFNFSSQGHYHKPPGLVIESYNFREATASNHKDIANSLFLTDNKYCYSAHWWHYQPFKIGKILRADPVTELRINHYYTKSYSEYLTRQNVSRGRQISEQRFQEINRQCNQVEDRSMNYYAQKLRENLKLL
ncbi:MAG: glycosyltransferase family 92 protein [Jaaginema sp. PMC 1079.18]|nr:glycosyltransferase family 92 protein [Jaaginema sp. PMC 1080.18]MEC4853589.1 glycosyltransferase family 92 protein [Jaaginema sp. PMC 1079.18]